MLDYVCRHDFQLNRVDPITEEVCFFPLLGVEVIRAPDSSSRLPREKVRLLEFKQKSCSPKIANSGNHHQLWERYPQVQRGSLHLESCDWSIPLVTEGLQHCRLEGKPFGSEISHVLCLFLLLHINWGSQDEFGKWGYIWNKMTFLQCFMILEKMAHTLECLLMITLSGRNKLLKVLNKLFFHSLLKITCIFSTGVQFLSAKGRKCWKRPEQKIKSPSLVLVSPLCQT